MTSRSVHIEELEYIDRMTIPILGYGARDSCKDCIVFSKKVSTVMPLNMIISIVLFTIDNCEIAISAMTKSALTPESLFHGVNQLY